MDPLDAIKDVIENKIKNLNPELEEEVIKIALESKLTSRVKILRLIRDRLSIPSQGSDKKNYWIKRGWSIEDAEKLRLKKKMPSSPMKIENWLSKINPITKQNYSREEAEFKIKSFRKLNKEYWISRGYTNEDAICEVKKYQKENSKIFVQKMIDNPSDYTSRVPTQIGYYLKRGYSMEESKQMLKRRQTTITLESFIERYGEYDGTLKYNTNVKNIGYTSSRKYYLDKYGTEEGNKIYDDRLLKRITPMSKSSKESFRFLLKIYKFLRRNGINKNDIYWGVGHSSEWFINNGDDIFFYDFTVRSLKFIVEYNGVKFHPKSEDDHNWKNIYNDTITLEYQLSKDKLKERSAKDAGFEYHVIFSDDNWEDKQIEIIEILKKKCQ